MGDVAQPVGRYIVIPRTLCFITFGEQVLLLRRAPDRPLWPNRVNGVGGHIEANEDVRSAALREIAEETGLSVADLRLRGVIHICADPQRPGVLLFLFTARALTDRVRASPEGDLIWADPQRLDGLDLMPDLRVLLPRILAMGDDEPPFFIHTDGRGL